MRSSEKKARWIVRRAIYKSCGAALLLTFISLPSLAQSGSSANSEDVPEAEVEPTRYDTRQDRLSQAVRRNILVQDVALRQRIEGVEGRRDFSVLGWTALGLGLINLLVLGFLMQERRKRIKEHEGFRKETLGLKNQSEQDRKSIDGLSQRVERLDERLTIVEPRETNLRGDGTTLIAADPSTIQVAKDLINSILKAVEDQGRFLDQHAKSFVSLAASVEAGVNERRSTPTVETLNKGAQSPLLSACTSEALVLKEAWDRWERREEWTRALGQKEEPEVRQSRSELVKSLGDAILGAPDLMGMLQKTLAPLREFGASQALINKIPEQLKLGGDDSPKRLFELRRAVLFLTNQSASERERALRGAHFGHWLEESFLPFADTFWLSLLRMPIERRARFKPAEGIVERALRVGGITRIETIPRETRFDSKLHEAISHENHGDVGDGVIVAVVKNGFTFPGGRVQHARVVVNSRSLSER